MRITCITVHWLAVMLLCACNSGRNEYSVAVDSTVDIKQVVISMEVLASIPPTEIFRGGPRSEIPNGYGENEWYVSVKDPAKGYFRHIKTNRNDYHKYRFYFYSKEDRHFVHVNVMGISNVDTVIQLK